MTNPPHGRGGGSDRGPHAVRLVLAAIASCLLHLLLWSGLVATRLTILGGAPEDATSSQPVLKPRLAADFPLQVPQSPDTARAAHERPLSLDVEPRQLPEPPRPAPDQEPRQELERRPPSQPEQPLPIVVTPPSIDRPAAATDVRGEPPRPESAAVPGRQRPAAIPRAAAATADAVAVAPATVAGDDPPQPAATARPAAEMSAAVSRPPPLEITGTEERPRAEPLPPSPQPLVPMREPAASSPAVMASPRAAIVPGVEAAPPPVPPTVAAVGAADVTGPRPQDAAAVFADMRGRVRRDDGTPRSVSSPTSATADMAAAAAGTAVSGADAAASVAGGSTPGRLAADGGWRPSAAAAPPLTRSSPLASPAGPQPQGPGPASAAIPIPARAGTAAASAGAEGGPPMPAVMSRRGDRPAAAGRGQAVAAAAEAAAAARESITGEELSSVAESGLFAAGLPTRDRGDDPAVTVIAPRPLGRVAAVTLPVEGRVREIAVPFARRSRANRNARGRERPDGDPVVSDTARVAADAIIDRGLDFLARAQQPDGRWRLGSFPGATAADTPKLSCDTAATGLAILSFLGAGHDHFGGRHRDTVRRGLEFLLSVQKPDGDLFLPADPLSNSCAWLYSHGIASMALCEAVGMTGDAIIKPAAAKACDFIAASQHPARGGWRYTPRSDADLSVSGWMLVALRSGRLAGIDVEPRAFAGVKTLLEASAIPDDPARYHYNPRNPQQRPSSLSAGCMTAVGALMRLHTGSTAADPGVRQSARRLALMRPTYGTARDKTRDCYLWYYASQVLVHTGGQEWTDWYDELATTLERTQERSGPAAGSWDPLGEVPDRWGQYGGRIYVTALHLLAIEVPDRRLPTYGSPDETGDR